MYIFTYTQVAACGWYPLPRIITVEKHHQDKFNISLYGITVHHCSTNLRTGHQQIKVVSWAFTIIWDNSNVSQSEWQSSIPEFHIACSRIHLIKWMKSDSDCQSATYIQYKYNVRSQGVPMIKSSDSKSNYWPRSICVYEVTIWRISNNLVVPQPKYYSSVLMNESVSCRTVSLKFRNVLMKEQKYRGRIPNLHNYLRHYFINWHQSP